MTRTLVIAVLLLSPAAGFASQVVQVSKNFIFAAITHPQKRAWRVGDEICIQKRKMVCGYVMKSNAKFGFIRLDAAEPTLAKNDPVSGTGKVRDIASVPAASSTSTARSSSTTGFNLSAGSNFGLTYLFTMLHFQAALFPNIAIGAMPMYSSSSFDTISANAVGGLLTFSYYFKNHFEGFYGQAAGGILMVGASSGAVSEQATTLTFQGSLGYRVNLIPHLNLGIAVGGQFCSDPDLALVTVNFSSFRPLFMVDIGYNF